MPSRKSDMTPPESASTFGERHSAVTACYDAVLFDLLTALLDSWTLWNSVAGDGAVGARWRGEYLRLTYGLAQRRLYTAGTQARAAAVEDVATAVRAGALPVGEEHGLPLVRFPLERTADAHRAVESGAVGKVLVDVPW
jgi:hypothetical protein